MLSTVSSSLHHLGLRIDSYFFLAVATDAQRNQVLGHASSGLSTYQKHYQSERVAIDVQTVYCDHPSKTLLRQAAGRMSLYRDPRAPVQLSPKEKQSVREDPTIQSLTEHCKTLKINRNWKRHTGAKAKAHGGSDCKELATARALLKSEIAHKERELFKIVRTKYFRSIGTIELNRQSCKEESDMDSNLEPTPKILHYAFEERKRLIHSLFRAVDPEKEPRSVMLEARLRAISDLMALCSKREIKRRETNMTLNKMSVSIETGNCASALDESDPICGMICLVCCGDPHLSQDDRIKKYDRKDILQKHFERHHSETIQARKSSWCGHPACSKSFIQGVTVFKNHAAMVHSILM